MISEDFILTSNTLLTVFEYMYMAISTAYRDMYSIVTISHVYISYSEEA